MFLAEQLGAAGFKRPVVLKRVKAVLAADDDYRQVLLQEAQLAMSLHHSNLVEVLDLGEAGGHHFLVMELVDGWTLHQVMRRTREAGLRLPPSLAVYIAAEICRGLAYAHQRTEGGEPLGIVHRDVCPHNVLLSTSAEVKVIDFGIARSRSRATQTAAGRTKGKPAWMSPEQARAEALDARSDLFSVGSVLFALLTDVVPFPAPNDLQVLKLVSRSTAPSPLAFRPDLPAELCAVVQMAMARDRRDRFGSADEMLLALEQLRRGVIEPAGRTELENFLRVLSAKDGDLAITRQPLAPARPLALPEWTPQSQPLPLRKPRHGRGWLGVLAASVLAGLGGVSLWAHLNPPVPSTRMVSAIDPASLAAWEEPLPPAPLVEATPLPVEESALRISARLAPRQRSRAKVSVIFESQPAGAVIKVDDEELGHTPATLQLETPGAYELSFESSGNAPVRQRLLLTPRGGKLPRVTLRTQAP